jgi:hypothetical protein
MATDMKKRELRLDEGGRWAVRSSSATVCLLDLDAMLLKRQHGSGSPSMPFDGQWVALVQVTSARGDTGVIRVGDRHKFLTDPDPGSAMYRWWIPQTCTGFEPLAEDAD